MKVLVTGASGFIGSYVIEELLNRNIDVIATSTNIHKAKKYVWFGEVKYKEFNFANSKDENLFEFFECPDLTIHLAWQGLPNYKADFHITDNLPQQKSFLNNLIINGLRDLTVTGTCFEYGLIEGELTETMISNPENAYAIAKNDLRVHLESLQRQYPFNLKWNRLFYMYGKGQNPKSLISQLDCALEKDETIFNMSGGEQVRDYLPIENVATNIVNIAVQKKIEGIINNCSGNPVTLKAFVEQYLQTKQKNIDLNLGYYPYPNFEPFKFWGNVEKLNRISL